MDELLKQIDNKRELVRVTRDALKRAIENRSLTSIERQKGTITKTANEIYELKVNVQAIRIGKGDNAEDIQTWTENVDQELEIWDREINDASKATTEWKQQEDKETTMREQEKIAETRREIHKEQLEFDKVQFEQKLQHEMKLEKARKEHEKAANAQTPLPSSTGETFAKQQLGVKSGQSALLGLSWDKKDDVIKIEIPSGKAQATKRGILKPSDGGILECHGRIQGAFPTYLPDNDMYTERLVEHAHNVTLHGGVGLTMAKVRQSHWIPRLRRLTRRVIKNCFGCRRFHATHFSNPRPGKLPKDRTEVDLPFQVVGVDYAGPIRYQNRGKWKKKTPESRPRETELRADVPEFRPKRNAATIAECRIQDIAGDEQN
ncbi:Hypothetical predicted protein [Paramuricea clavata]|uniref:Uncharacterized protein n=1 Tax=Paramuricea clavata TaxID=317549 RepID=A0A6S7GX08_PARCT|nr:Hypothetical predicted protein [Paramuricea clavata]